MSPRKPLFDPRIFDVRIFRNTTDGPDFVVQGNYTKLQVSGTYGKPQIEGHWRNEE